MKNKRLVAIFLVMTLGLGMVACSEKSDKKSHKKDKKKDKTKVEEVETSAATAAVASQDGMVLDVKYNGQSYNFTPNDYLFDRYQETLYFQSSYLDGESEVNGIKVGDDLSKVEALLKPGYAHLNYEFDPYHDGCTEIGNDIYDGDLSIFDELYIMDCAITIAFENVDGKYVMVEYDEDELAEKDVIYVTYDIADNDVYGEDINGKVYFIEVTA